MLLVGGEEEPAAAHRLELPYYVEQWRVDGAVMAQPVADKRHGRAAIAHAGQHALQRLEQRHLSDQHLLDEDIVDEAEDTVTIMKKFIDKFNLSVDKTELGKVVQGLYDEALTLE